MEATSKHLSGRALESYSLSGVCEPVAWLPSSLCNTFPLLAPFTYILRFPSQIYSDNYNIHAFQTFANNKNNKDFSCHSYFSRPLVQSISGDNSNRHQTKFIPYPLFLFSFSKHHKTKLIYCFMPNLSQTLWPIPGHTLSQQNQVYLKRTLYRPTLMT